MKPALPEPESSPQDGGGSFSAAELGGGGAGPEETARSHCHEQPQHASEAAAAAVPKGAEEPERPLRRSFQIPRKSREKKGGASPPPRSPTPLSLFSPFIFSLGPLCLLSHTHPTHVNTHSGAGARGEGASTLRRSPSPRASWKELRFEARP